MSKTTNDRTTIVIRRPAKISTDARGRSVWAEPVDDVELELVSTAELQLALRAASEKQLEEIASVARSDQPGLVARNRETGVFTLVTDAEMETLQWQGHLNIADVLEQEIADVADGGPDLSLVSTQSLKKMLALDDSDDSVEIQIDCGFDPYNHD